MHVELCTQDKFLGYQTYLDPFFKKSVTVRGHKWSISTYKLFMFTAHSRCVCVSQQSSGMLTFDFTLVKPGAHPDLCDIPHAYSDLAPMKAAKACDVGKML